MRWGLDRPLPIIYFIAFIDCWSTACGCWCVFARFSPCRLGRRMRLESNPSLERCCTIWGETLSVTSQLLYHMKGIFACDTPVAVPYEGRLCLWHPSCCTIWGETLWHYSCCTIWGETLPVTSQLLYHMRGDFVTLQLLYHMRGDFVCDIPVAVPYEGRLCLWHPSCCTIGGETLWHSSCCTIWGQTLSVTSQLLYHMRGDFACDTLDNRYEGRYQ